MTQIKPEQLAYELNRWMRPDAHRFIRSDWRRYVNPSSTLATLYELYERKYRHDQPRVPAGSREGGQWIDDAQSRSRFSDGLVRLAQADTGVISDAFGEPYYRPGGHHEAPQAVYNKWDLQKETRKVFENSTTGKIPLRLRMAPDGKPIGNFWSRAHNEYNKAFEDLADKFMEKNNITSKKQMTPEHAREILKEVRETTDPRIRDLNSSMRLLRGLYRLRGGRE
jgi:hypothetical protein